MNADELRKEFGDKADEIARTVAVIADSYTDAALVLDLGIDAVERAVLDMARRYAGCVSCRYSQAGRNADEYALKRGSLPITTRGCVLGLRQEGCTAYEPIVPR